MLRLWMQCMLVAGVVLAALPITSLVLAQTPASIPDLSGVWERRGVGTGPEPGLGADGAPAFGFTKEAPPLQPWALEQYNAVRNGPLRNRYDKALDEFDPGLHCFPHGPTRLFTVPWPFELHQFPHVVVLLSEWDHWVRRIYMDGRGHPDGYPVTWMGHSIGKYEDDALVVDTVKINDRAWVDAMGTPHSPDLHVVERFRRVNQETLEGSFLFEDPKAFTRPWTAKKVFRLQPPGRDIMEHLICEDWLEIGKKRQPTIAPSFP